MMPPERFELSTQERHDPLWIKLTENFEDRIARLRESNDAIDATPDQTLKIRTEIELYKKLLKL